MLRFSDSLLTLLVQLSPTSRALAGMNFLKNLTSALLDEQEKFTDLTQARRRGAHRRTQPFPCLQKSASHTHPRREM